MKTLKDYESEYRRAIRESLKESDNYVVDMETWIFIKWTKDTDINVPSRELLEAKITAEKDKELRRMLRKFIKNSSMSQMFI